MLAVALVAPCTVDAAPRSGRVAVPAPPPSPGGADYLKFAACQTALDGCERDRRLCAPPGSVVLQACARDRRVSDVGACAQQRLGATIQKCMRAFGVCVDRAQRLCAPPAVDRREDGRVDGDGAGGPGAGGLRLEGSGGAGGMIKLANGRGGAFGEHDTGVGKSDSLEGTGPIASVKVGGLDGEDDASGSKSDIAKKIAGRTAAVKACFEAALRDNPDVSGRVKVSFTVGTAGTFSGVTVAGAEGDFRNCVETKFKSIRGLPILTAPKQFNQSFVFSKEWGEGSVLRTAPRGHSDIGKPGQPPETPAVPVGADSSVQEASKFAALARQALSPRSKVLYLERATMLDPANSAYQRELLTARGQLQAEE